jgi:hypothetical protein
LIRARNEASLVRFGRAVVSTMTVISGWLGDIGGLFARYGNLQFLELGLEHFAVGRSAA